jgi:hypothetical protein
LPSHPPTETSASGARVEAEVGVVDGNSAAFEHLRERLADDRREAPIAEETAAVVVECLPCASKCPNRSRRVDRAGPEFSL